MNFENYLVSNLNSNRDKNILGDFFSSVTLVDRVTWYMILVKDDKYPVKLVEVHIN